MKRYLLFFLLLLIMAPSDVVSAPYVTAAAAPSESNNTTVQGVCHGVPVHHFNVWYLQRFHVSYATTLCWTLRGCLSGESLKYNSDSVSCLAAGCEWRIVESLAESPSSLVIYLVIWGIYCLLLLIILFIWCIYCLLLLISLFIVLVFFPREQKSTTDNVTSANDLVLDNPQEA